MNSKKLKNKLNAEIGRITPDVLQNVVNSSYIEKPTQGGAAKTKKKFSPRRITAVAVSCCAVLLVVGICLGVFMTGEKEVAVVSNASYVTVSVIENGASAAEAGVTSAPSVSFTADNANKIETVRADNEGGRQLLDAVNGENVLIGKSLADGAKDLAEAAAKLGYIDVTAAADEQSAYVEIKIAATADVKLNVVKAEIKSNVTSFFKQSGIYAYVSDTSYTREELVSEIGTFDNTVSLSDAMSTLNAKMAERKSYYDELAAQADNREVGLFKVYSATLIQSIDELIAKLNKEYDFITVGILNSIKDTITAVTDITSAAISGIKSAVSNYISTLMNMAGVDDKISGYLSSVPDNLEELGDYLNSVSARRVRERIDAYSDAFNNQRPVISDTEYETFEKDFIR